MDKHNTTQETQLIVSRAAIKSNVAETHIIENNDFTTNTEENGARAKIQWHR